MRYSVSRVASSFAFALDTDDYEALADLLSADCEYIARSGVFHGPVAIIASYRDASTWAKARIDSVIYASSVRVENDNNALVTFIDHLEDSGLRHSYCCEQSLAMDPNGRVCRIVHREIPGQREAVDSFLLQIGVLQNSEPANEQDA
jgi:hypothetical protein